MEGKKGIKKGWIIFLAILLVIVLLFTIAWTVIAPKLDTEGLRYLFTNAAGSFFTKNTNEEVTALLDKTGGWVTGVCHPHDNETAVTRIKDANIGWVRFDLTSLPYDKDTHEPTQGYLDFKARARYYTERGLKVMCVTQYPRVYLNAGIDFRTEEGKQTLSEMAAFIAQDLQDCVSGLQITNEMGIDRFRDPISMEEAAEYIGTQLEAIKDVKGNLIVGYNLAGFTIYSFMALMKPWTHLCDYVGLDLYLGCFEDIMKELWFYDLMFRAIWNFTKKPVLLNEFGYMGYGKLKTDAEKAEILRNYGFENEAAARADIRTFFSRLPQSFQDDVNATEWHTDEDLVHLLFETEKVSHIYKEIQNSYKLRAYDHTPEDQARFFTDAIARFAKIPFLCGAIVYCYGDSDACYVCGQPDCPVETGWGLVDVNGNPKPCYYTVKEAFGKILGK